MNHTKEPWYKHKGNTGIIYGNDGISIAAGHNNEIAHRIVACVNACAGITNEALEKGLIKCAVENLAQNLPYDDGNFYFDDVKVWEDV